MYAEVPDSGAGEPGEFEVSLRHLVPLVVTLCAAIWVLVVALSDQSLIMVIAMPVIGVLSVLVVKALLDQGWRTRARQGGAERRQYLTACALAVILPVAVAVWGVATQSWEAPVSPGDQRARCTAEVSELIKSVHLSQEQAEQYVGDTDPHCR